MGSFPLATPSTPPPSSTSPLVLSERLRFHPRNHVGTPTTVYHRRRRPTSNGRLTPSPFKPAATDVHAQDQDLPVVYHPPHSTTLHLARNFDRKGTKVEIKSGNLSPRDKFNFLFFPNFIYIYVHLKLSCYRMIFEARNRLFWFV